MLLLYRLHLVRVEYIQLALQYKPLNLGQGFPDYFAPENVTNALAAIAKSDNPLLQQYTRSFVSISVLLIFNSIYIYFCINYKCNITKVIIVDKQ